MRGLLTAIKSIVPWSCDSAGVQWTLQSGVIAVQGLCHHLGLTSCQQSHFSVQCSDRLLVAPIFLICAITAIYLSARYRWYAPKQSGTLAAAAAAAAAQLRRAHPNQYPAASHAWYRIAGRQLAKPLLCAVCFDHMVMSDDDSTTMNACEVCGVVAHEGCARHVPHDCRPVAVDASDMAHLWRPAGITTSATLQDDAEALLQTCHYCHQLCEADAFCWEPIWECAWCFSVAHVRCYQRAHPRSVKDQSDASKGTEGQRTTRGISAPSSTQPVPNGVPVDASAPAQDGKVSPDTDATCAVVAQPLPATGQNGLPRIKTPRRKSHTSVMLSRNAVGNGVPEPAVLPSSVSSDDAAATQQSGQTCVRQPTYLLPLQPPRRLGSYSRVGSLGRLMTALSAMVSDVADGDKAQSSPTAATTASGWSRFGESDVARLDRCGLGPHWRFVMPPTSFTEVPSITWSARAKSLLPSRGGHRAGGANTEGTSHPVADSTAGASQSAVGQLADTSAAVGAAAMAATSKVVQRATAAAASVAAVGGSHASPSSSPQPDADSDATQLAPVASVPVMVSSAKRGPRKKTKQPSSMGRLGHSWWGLPRDTPWHNYSLGRVPAGLKPILVFINTKSGPQTGRDIRRKFLRVLNPLQVVELPRERPERALALFADVAGLRILVVGGDGTVGWVLSCLDTLQEQRQAAHEAALDDDEPSGTGQDTSPAWLPPPMAVFPIGTGNDLARCLNWGGNMKAYHGAAPSQLLTLLEQSAITLLDRWKVTFSPLPPAHKRTPKDAASQQDTASSSASSTPSPALDHVPSPTAKGSSVKAMNNYMGIGIDAKVALEFHHIREQYPEWFHSQFGNKLWYTGVGAKDMLAQSSLHLSTRIKLVCDGVEVHIPPDTEGILLLNIPSYMGGVDIWASGRPADPLADEHPQSLCDGRLEVVAVYGSWHLGQMQVGLSRARRLVQCRHAQITLSDTMPMQVDGEPWRQAACEVSVTFRSAALMLRHLASAPLARMAAAVSDALDSCQAKAMITATQRHALTTELAAHLHSVM